MHAGRDRLWTGARVASMAGALLLAGCSTAPTPTGTPSDAPGSTSIVPGSSSVTGSTAPEIVVGSGSFIAPEVGAGLSDLTSYRATLTKAFDGTVGGAAQKWSVTIGLELGAAGTHLSVVTEGSRAVEIPGDLYEIDGSLYAVKPGAGCTAGIASDAGTVRTMAEPASQLYAVIGGDPTGNETVNGIAATHVTFDERAIGLSGLATASGELWDADGRIVRYRLRAEGGPGFFGEGVSGSQTWQYELTDVNQPIAIEAPAACPAGRVGAEAMAGATAVVDVPGLLAYEVGGAIKDVIAFYESKAASMGWTRSREPLMDKAIGVIEYTSDRGPVTVLIQAADGKLRVFVALDRG